MSEREISFPESFRRTGELPTISSLSSGGNEGEKGEGSIQSSYIKCLPVLSKHLLGAYCMPTPVPSVRDTEMYKAKPLPSRACPLFRKTAVNHVN